MKKKPSQKDLIKEFQSRKRQADHLWDGIIVKINFNEELSINEILHAMEATNTADYVYIQNDCFMRN